MVGFRAVEQTPETEMLSPSLMGPNSFSENVMMMCLPSLFGVIFWIFPVVSMMPVNILFFFFCDEFSEYTVDEFGRVFGGEFFGEFDGFV